MAALSRLLAAAGLSLLCLAAALAMGCASAPVTITYGPGEAGTLTSATPQLQSVTIQPRAYGRQCFAVDTSSDGTVAVVYAVDASSDWAGVRVLPSVLPEMVAAVMSVVSAPVDLIAGLLGVSRPEMAQPSEVSACSAIFED